MASTLPERSPTRPGRIPGLDSLRLVLASTVVLDHLGIPKTQWLNDHRVAGGIANNMFVGVAAVIGFFIISGFCIHISTVRGQRLALAPYFVRRQIRITLPLSLFVALAYPTGWHEYVSVLWSLVCEEIYYALYPFLLRLRSRFGNLAVMALAILAATLVLVLVPHNGNFHAPGYALTWALGLPIWIAGCGLAEWYERKGATAPAVTSRKLWAWRCLVALLASIASFLRFHTAFDYEYSLLLLAPILLVWLRFELTYWRDHPPPAMLELAGKASYAIYLTHLCAIPLVRLSGRIDDGWAYWVAELVAVALISATFYLVVELPAHRLAKFASDWLVRRTALNSPSVGQVERERSAS